MEDTESSNDSAIAQTEIATHGDVIFVVGPQKKKIRVCSIILKHASAYFRTMFGPQNVEGKNLKSNDPKEIPMPDDNAGALEIMFNVIHHRNDAVPQSLSPTDVFEVAVAADKFDCAVALQHASTLWLNPKDVKEISGLCRLMAAAYILDNAQAFSEITLSIVFSHVGSYLPLADQVVNLLEFVPWKVLYLLEEKRNKIRTELQQLLFEGLTHSGDGGDKECTCAWPDHYSLAYTMLLQKQKLQPSKIAALSISQVIGRLDLMEEPTISFVWTPCSYRWHAKANYRVKRDAGLRQLRKRDGLCIDCVRSDATAVDQAHRMKHLTGLFT